MLYITVCVLAILGVTDVHGRYLYESTIRGSIETNKIISNWEDALTQCKSEGAVLAAPTSDQLRDEMIDLIRVNNHSTPYFINAKIVHSHKLQFVSSEGVSLDDMSVSDMIDELDPREGDCLAMDAHTIRVVSCSMPLPYMCYKESNTGTSNTKQVFVETTTEHIVEITTEQEINPCGTTDKKYILNPITGSCYKYHDEARNWDVAHSLCTDEGGYLTIINDEKEARVIQGMNHAGAWVGLRDYTDSYDWISVQGDSIEQIYNVWHDFHNPYPGLNCVTIDSKGRLDDYECEDEKPFICEKESRTKQTIAVTKPAPVAPEDIQTTCGTSDNDYKLNPTTGSCYKYHDERLNWFDADAVCTSEGGYLTIVNDQQEANALHDMGYVRAYIGLRDYNDSDVWTSVKGDSIDNLYNVWHTGHNPHTKLDCAVLDIEAKLDDYRCEAVRPFVCERDPRKEHILTVDTPKTTTPITETSTLPTASARNKNCDFDQGYRLSSVTGRCYNYHREQKTWDDAKSACTAEGGYLAIINDEQEANAIRDMGYVGAFIGLRDYDDNNIWTSVHGDSIDHLFSEWHDGHNPYTNWNCAVINGRAKLDDYSCQSQRSFVCEKDPHTKHISAVVIPQTGTLIAETTTVPTAPADNLECDIHSGYRLSGVTGKCYNYHSESKTWDDADSACTAEGGYLAIINDEQEANAIRDMGYAGAHIGLRYYEENNTWTSVHGDNIEQLFSEWHEGHDPLPYWNCAVIDGQGKLDDYGCDSERSFVCEKDPHRKHMSAVAIPQTATPISETTTVAPADNIECDINEGYRLSSVTGRCYNYHSESKNWDDANLACTSEGGYLAIVNDEQEADAIRDMGYADAFIGLRDYDDNNTWTSVHGDSIEQLFSQWHEGHNPYTHWNCAVINGQGKLDDYGCQSERSFVCEKDPHTKHISAVVIPQTAETVTVPTAPADNIECDINEGYRLSSVTSRCYNYHSEHKSWDDANLACTSEGGYLAIVNDEQEADAIRDMGYAGAFIGLRDYNDNNTWTSVHGDNIEQLFSEWHQGHNPNTHWNCAVINNSGKLDDYLCDSVRSFVCEKDPHRNYKSSVAIPQNVTRISETTTMPTAIAYNLDCDIHKGYRLSRVTSRCYNYHRMHKTWDDANSACTAEGGYLAIINDEQEANAIRDMGYAGAFIGLRDYDDNNTWTSVHGDSIDQLFSEWHQGHNPYTHWNCAVINDRGKLDDYDCESIRSFVCEKDPRRKPLSFVAIPQTGTTFTKATTLPATSAAVSECGTYDAEYKLDTLTGSCYKFHGEHKSWYDANTTCVLEGGYLAVVNDEHEAQAIKAKKYPTQGFGAFIGLRNLKGELGWTSITGVPLAQLYHIWHWGHGPVDHLECGMLSDSGFLDDQFCFNSRPFLCEKDPRSKTNTLNNNAAKSIA